VRSPAAYPIASFTWLLLYESPADKAQAKAMVGFLNWAETEGQGLAASLVHYLDAVGILPPVGPHPAF